VTEFGRKAVPTCTFRTLSSAGAWQVTRDGVFYGDYLTRREAAEGACSAARSFEAVGGQARVLASPGEIVIPHQHPRFKS
jgi:hypothetical protein